MSALAQAGHWADAYVGRKAEGRHPCWLLVRQVWSEQLQFDMPCFDEAGDPETVIGREAMAFAMVKPGGEQEFDAVLMKVPGGVPHIGVIAAKGLVLHQQRDALSSIEPMKHLQVTRILRGAWFAREAG